MIAWAFSFEYLKILNNPSAKILVLQFYIDTLKKIN